MELLRFSAEHVQEDKRASVAREMYSVIANIDIATVEGAAFSSRMNAASMPDLRVATIANSACTVHRAQRHVVSGNDDWVLIMISEGNARIGMVGYEEIECGPGEAYLIRNDMRGTFLLGSVRHTHVSIPNAMIAPRIADPDRVLVKCLGAETAAELRYLAEYCHMLTARDQPLPPALAGQVATHVQDLATIVLRGGRDEVELARTRGLRAARVRALLHDIACHALDGEMNIEAVARRQQLSPRYIRKLLGAMGTTFSDRVVEVRLTRAHDMLCDPRCDHIGIGEIAYRVGFNDLTYFNRTFRRRFGVTPTDARHG